MSGARGSAGRLFQIRGPRTAKLFFFDFGFVMRLVAIKTGLVKLILSEQVAIGHRISTQNLCKTLLAL